MVDGGKNRQFFVLLVRQFWQNQVIESRHLPVISKPKTQNYHYLCRHYNYDQQKKHTG